MWSVSWAEPGDFDPQLKFIGSHFCNLVNDDRVESNCFPIICNIYFSESFKNTQTEQMGRIVNDLDTVHFSIKKATQLVKEIGRQVGNSRALLLYSCL